MINRSLVLGSLVMLVCACTNPTAAGIAPEAVDLKSSLSAAFDAFTLPGSAACSISISQHGQAVLERGRGQIAPGRPASVDSTYRIASLTKPITASAILISEKAGRISRTDKINRFLAFPEPAPSTATLHLASSFPAIERALWCCAAFPGNSLPNFVLGPGGIRSIMLAVMGKTSSP
jgi:CubicO group peptidase (beta-lactamase class C family)